MSQRLRLSALHTKHNQVQHDCYHRNTQTGEVQVYLEGFAILQTQSGQGIADDDTQVLPLLKGCANALCIAPATSTHTQIESSPDVKAC